jgi:signal transduction histidine kinase/DNA-binding response OmpR family regulator
MITLVAEFLFALIFVRALARYFRDRDSMQRDVALVFLPMMAIFVNNVLVTVGVRLPDYCAWIPTALLMGKSYFTVRLIGRLRATPRWLHGLMLAIYLASALPLAFAPRPLSIGFVAVVVVVVAFTELVTGSFLVSGATWRTGAARIRMMIAGGSTYLVTVFMALVGINALVYPHVSNSWLTSLSRVDALLSGIGYLIAFMPPAPLRRMWSATVWYGASQRLQDLPVTVDAAEVWRRCVDIVRSTTGVDAVVALEAASDGGLRQRALAGLRTPEPSGYTMAELERSDRGARTMEVPGKVPAVAAHYAYIAGARYVAAVPLAARHAVLLLLDRHRTLFTDDDLKLVAVLGTQAQVLADRAEIMGGQRELAQQLSASVDALTHANQAKTDFLAGMSHELRTPLNAIIGFSDLMRAEQPDGDRRTVPAEWVDHIHGSGRHLLGLINDILDLAKVEAGRLELSVEPLPLEVAVIDVITGLRPLTERKSLRVISAIPRVAVRADPLRFRQILDNLLSNAIKFTPEGGQITVSAERVDDQVAITVADSGIGIPQADLDRVFEEFQQLGDAATRKAGTGLGLALTRRLVEAHGGSIDLTSTVGKGSRFTVLLPDATSSMPAVPADLDQAFPAGSSSRGRVLIVDDDRRGAELLRTYLIGAGYEVATAVDGEAGLRAAREWRPAAVVLDVMMPGIDGWSVIRALKRDESLRDIPVFFATIVDDRKAGLELGATDYFVKPVDQDLLLAQLARHVIPARSPERSSVLVVDSDDVTRHVVEDHLRADGIEVVACDDGREGLRLSRERQFDLIICDLELPDVDGFTLLQGLDDNPTTRGIPVLALAEPDLSEVDRMRLTGKIIGTVPRSAATADGLREWVDLAMVTSSMAAVLAEGDDV